MTNNVANKGTIIKLLAGFYYVSTDNGEVITCRARGAFRNKGITPLVGDRVVFSSVGNEGTVQEILTRKNELVRPAVANVDRVVIISSFSTPAPNTLVIDRMTALAQNSSIEAVIVFNKSDLGDFSEIANVYKNSGFKVFVVSANTGEGIEELKNYLSSGFSVFTGNTGVGKSSILNRLLPDADIPTGEVSEKLGRGRHTTRHIELYSLCNGAYIADTPGFSALSFEGAGFIPAKEIEMCFPDIYQFSSSCKFTGCSHLSEKGCAVINALNSSKIETSRYDSYKTMYNEVCHIKDWEIKKIRIK